MLRLENKPRPKDKIWPAYYILEKMEGFENFDTRLSHLPWKHRIGYFLLSFRQRNKPELVTISEKEGWRQSDYLRYFGLPENWIFDPVELNDSVQKLFDKAYKQSPPDHIQAILDDEIALELMDYYIGKDFEEWKANNPGQYDPDEY